VSKRSLFVKAFIANGGNATQAAIAAGYSAKTAKQTGSRMLTFVDVKAAVEAYRAHASERAGLSAERTLQEVARIAYFDPRRLFDEKGNLKLITDLDDDTAAGVASVEHLEEYQGRGEDRELVGHTKKVKIADKNSALDKAMKHFGLYDLDNRQKPATQVNVGLLTVGLEFDKVRARALGRKAE